MKLLKLDYLKIRRIVLYFLVILNSGYALTTGYEKELMILTVTYMVFDILLMSRQRVVAKNGLIFIVILVSQIIVAFIVNFDVLGAREYVRLVIFLAFCYYVFISFTSEELINAFCDFMFVSSVISLIFFVVVLFFPQFALQLTNGYDVQYSSCFLAFVNTSLSYRNCGVFWEPSVFAAMCFLWGFFEITIIKQTSARRARLVILLLSIITAQSTSGYIYIVFLLMLLLMGNSDRKYSFRRLAVVVLGVFVGLFLFVNFETLILRLADTNSVVFRKILLQNASVTDRTIGPLADLYVAFHNPLGVGVGNLTLVVENAALDVFGIVLHTRTSTITYYFAAFGLVSGLMILLALINFLKINIKSILFAIVALCGFIILSVSSPLHDSAIFIILIMMGTSKNPVQNFVRDRRPTCESYGQ